MSFKTQAEIYQALLDGKMIKNNSYASPVMLIAGTLKRNEGRSGWIDCECYFTTPSNWSLHEEPKKITLYRYTYEDGKDFYQTLWRSKASGAKMEGQKILKTETKDVEI